MRWFQNLSFRYKLMIPLVLLAGLFIAMAGAAINKLIVLGADVDELAAVDVSGLNFLLQADRELVSSLAKGDGARATVISLGFSTVGSAFDSTRDQIDAMGEVMLNRTQAIAALSQQDVSSGMSQVMSILVAGIIIIIVVAIGAPALILKPMKALVGHLENVAQDEGGLTVRLDDKGRIFSRSTQS